MTRNISDTGIFLVASGDGTPPIGTVVRVRLQGNLGGGDEPPTLLMKVVREEPAGIGLTFVEE
jgi:hypothetical protein